MAAQGKSDARLRLEVRRDEVEAHTTREAAKTRERQIKQWRRAWKLRLIEMSNPDWKDLSLDLNNWYPYRNR
jgi:predicted GIY-YIG superfamily endonuclease